jgi:dihydrofolate reductase
MSTVTAIAAVAENGVLGKDGALPWHLPADLARFQALTRGHHLIVGRRTWESIGRPLPGRKFVVVSRGPAPAGFADGWVSSVRAAIAAATAQGDAQPFVAGGAGIYREALEHDLLDRLELTRVHAAPDGDTWFPPFDVERWIETARVERPADERNRFALTFLTYDRRDGVLSSPAARRSA